ncbi:hypothetical protein CC85DRAFT_289254 [Cutaneotrichosporon oleaginosum]|uniref:Transmembrane protein n=1 Tax=Cutaneotrichosporon oleaginosum TaxID=879819 RepID=A0A0J0XCB5_9TREE|nr:uncharacterized protein CC85DRAFT_289254 [Cutaneotrichosporon oleaginosum]KLT38710.1 hypothetical protein CC85DRAFT_289254 [Cutaneotrichosporon oleaginosum]TXT15459.1 hypothetical protein COLE_01652 [Cutaneotrichosporon oleaginosum]
MNSTGAGAVVNPFFLLGRGVQKKESVAFTFVYALFLVLLCLRLAGRPKFWLIYIFVVLFTGSRVATFIVRWLLADASPSDDSYKILLIIAGVFVVAGFLFLVEAVLSLLFEWFCILREVDNPRLRHIMIPIRHSVVLGISILGIVGAVLQITALDSLNLRQFDVAKALRQASGALFMVVSAHLMLSPLGLLLMYNPIAVKRAIPTAVISICGTALMLESLFRVVAASVTSGWFLTQNALNILLFMPEVVVLLAFTLLDMDDLRNVGLVSCTKHGYDSTPSASTKGADAEAHQMGAMH